MEISNLDRGRTIAGALASIALVGSLFLLEWFSLSTGEERIIQQAWVCGEGDYSCTGWETFGILRYLLILAALAPAILGYILIRGHKLSYPPGEMTMVAGFAAFVLIAYNGILFKPKPEDGQVFGESLGVGYWVALLAAAVIGVVGYLRSQASGGKQQRKAPGTV
jgi:ABC-type Fe3+ transport system permease subunit